MVSPPTEGTGRGVQANPASWIATGSLIVGVVVLAIKMLAWWLTGSVGLFSDALESVINVATAGAALLAIRVSALPADANHPYGHSKAEYFSAVLEGVLIIIAAGTILREAYLNFLAPRMIDAPLLGLLINGVATAINAVWAGVLVRQGRRLRSPALSSDGRHLITDVVTSVGVWVGVGLATLFHVPVLDPVVAALVALNILWSGWGLVKESVGGLMDAAAPPEQVDRIRSLIATNAKGAIEAHDLRTRHAGRVTFVDFHLVVAGDMPVSEAHDICDRIEKALRAKVPDALITIHVEPEEKAKHQGVLVI